jgi:hypothetical protein
MTLTKLDKEKNKNGDDLQYISCANMIIVHNCIAKFKIDLNALSPQLLLNPTTLFIPLTIEYLRDHVY